MSQYRLIEFFIDLVNMANPNEDSAEFVKDNQNI